MNYLFSGFIKSLDMKFLFTFLCIFLFVFSCAEEKPVDLELGENVFKTNCVICHGQDGKLAVNGAKDLALSKMTVEKRQVIISEGKNLMTPFKSLLSEEKIKAVAHYTLKFSNE
jgi:mono/diheme cytochrome c family protein